MNIIIFITSVVWICSGFFISNNPTLDKWQSNLLAILMIVVGCAGAGVALFH